MKRRKIGRYGLGTSRRRIVTIVNERTGAVDDVLPTRELGS